MSVYRHTDLDLKKINYKKPEKQGLIYYAGIDYKNEPDEPDEDLSDVDVCPDSVDNYNNEPDEPDEPDYDDDVFEVPKTTDINTQHSVELNNDLLTNTSNLEYEKYDYESCIIPVM